MPWSLQAAMAGFQLAFQEMAFQQDAVPEGLAPTSRPPKNSAGISPRTDDGGPDGSPSLVASFGFAGDLPIGDATGIGRNASAKPKISAPS